MITEDFCSYELSKLLKEKGFDIELQCYSYDAVTKENVDIYWQKNINGLLPRCTHQMAMRFLRKKGIYVYVEPYMVGGTYIEELKVHYCGRILDTNRRRLYSIENMTSYPEAIEERIEYALKNLI